MMKKYLGIMLLLSACASTDVGMLKEGQTPFQETEVQNVEVMMKAPVPANCKQISMAITDPMDSMKDIIRSLKEEASKVGGNFVNVDTLGYVTEIKDSEKYASAVIYLCE
ncbi:MAG: hypothetical protein IJC30_04185 [Alphaproteobacteria bacterium]|nr:hypothetical protein [Alphaproteobacteria bacterium]